MDLKRYTYKLFIKFFKMHYLYVQLLETLIRTFLIRNVKTIIRQRFRRVTHSMTRVAISLSIVRCTPCKLYFIVT